MNPQTPFDFEKDDSVDGMTVIAPIVRGGHGDLYLVSGAEDGRKHVLKLIRKPDNESEFTGIEKCRAISSHIPGLVSILKVGRLADGRVWCVMPAADNLAKEPDYEPDTLAARIRRDGRIPPGEVLELAKHILTTIKALHEAGLAHCDIKPDNIVFIGGQAMLTDYSLLSDTLNHLVDAPFGTPGFVPPEMQDDSAQYEPRASDLYAVGKLIYTAWSGTDALLFPSVSREIPLTEIGIMLPIYMKACSNYPNRRFQDADEFIASISDAQARLRSRTLAWGRKAFREYRWILPSIILVLCVTALLLFLRPGGRVKSDPLVVTTPWDVMEPDDGTVSLREALAFAQTPGGLRKISFNMPDSDSVQLTDPALIKRNMRFATTNEKSGNPVDIVLDSLIISNRRIATPEEDIADGGGAVLHANTGRFIVRKGVFSGNADEGAGGTGGAFRMVDCFLSIDSAVFQNNAAFSAGGALNLERTRALIQNTQFSGNRVNGFGGALDLSGCPEVRIIDSCFEFNRTGDNDYYGWCGGAIQLEGGNLILEVSEGLTIINEGNESGHGGFLTLAMYDKTLPKCSGAEFRINGAMIIGDGDGRDSIATSVRTGPEYTDAPRPVQDISSYNIFIRKTGKGILSINAPVSDYDGQWFLEEGALVFTYDKGGDLDGAITISGGQMVLDDPHKFKTLTFRPEKPNERPFIVNLFNLTGGTFYIDASKAADGTYLLADGVDSFSRTFTLRNVDASGESSVALSVGQAVTVGGASYTLSMKYGTLSLTKTSAGKTANR